MKRFALIFIAVLCCQLLAFTLIPSGEASQNPSRRVPVPNTAEQSTSPPAESPSDRVRPQDRSPQKPQPNRSNQTDQITDPNVMPPTSQNPDQTEDGDTIKIGSEEVQVIFSVIDERGRLVTDLNPAEVVLSENGKKQSFDLFQRSTSLPMILSVLLDVSGSQQFLLDNEKAAVATFFDSFFREGKDYGAILTFHGETEMSIGLTSNLQRLKTSLQKIRREEVFRDDEGGVSNLGTALYDALDTTAREVLNGRTARRLTSQDVRANQTTRPALRRAIFVLTDGVDTASQIELKQALRSVQGLGISIYALGVGDRFRFGSVNQDVLNRLCKASGGRAFYPKDEYELRQNFQQIANELSSQYIIAYSPESAADPNFREIDIQIPKHPEWQVVHRRGYTPEEKNK